MPHRFGGQKLRVVSVSGAGVTVLRLLLLWARTRADLAGAARVVFPAVHLRAPVSSTCH